MFAWCRLPKHVSLTKDPAAATAAKLLQSCSTLCNPIDGSLPGFSVPGTLQARTLERVAIAFSEYVLNAALRKELRIFTKASEAVLLLTLQHSDWHGGPEMWSHLQALGDTASSEGQNQGSNPSRLAPRPHWWSALQTVDLWGCQERYGGELPSAQRGRQDKLICLLTLYLSSHTSVKGSIKQRQMDLFTPAPHPHPSA